MTVYDTTGSLQDLSNKLHSHAPASIITRYTTPGIHTGGVTVGGTNYDGAKQHEIMAVDGEENERMPGVFVQERFASVPLGFGVNVDGVGWQTRYFSIHAVDYILQGGPNYHIYWTDDQGKDNRFRFNGWFGYFDNFWYVWALGDRSTISLVQEYWAGTWSATGAHGINVGTFDLVFTVGPSVGDRGTVTHTKR